MDTGGWQAELPRCLLLSPPFPDSLPLSTTECPVCVDEQAQKGYKLCPAAEYHTLQCVGGAWQEAVEWDVPCNDG
jgi:hypothetical protein